MWTRAHVYASAFVFVCTAASAAENAYGPFNIQSGKVTKQPYEDVGKSADHSQIFSAEPERFFLEDSWTIKMISAHGKNTWCRFENFHRVPVQVTLPNGQKSTIPMVNSFAVRAHAETGSGLTPDVRTAFAECETSAKTVRFD
jgi:hypothetical protein